MPEPIILKPLQTKMVNQLRVAMQQSKKVILQAATGVGKTVIAAYITKSAYDKGKTVLFIVDRIILANQTSSMFSRYGIPHGVIRAHDERFDISQQVQVASIQTLQRRGCNPADLIIIDEAHVLHLSHQKIMADNPKSFIIGLTASPYSRGLGKHFDFHIQPSTFKELVKEKYLVDYDVYAPSITDLSALKVKAGEFTEESLSEAYDKVDIIGDVVKTWLKLANGRKTIVFGVSVAHIKHLVEEFKAAGIPATQINAYQSTEEREEALYGFCESDTTKVLCSAEAAVKGFDSPDSEVCCLAVATKSMIKLTQTTGRVLRVCEGKEKALILDFGGNFERLGFPDEHELHQLDTGKKKKKSEVEPKEKLPKSCPSCSFIKPVGVRKCPACGFEPEFKQDVDVLDAELKKLQRKDKTSHTIEQKQSFLAQLNTYAASKGMKEGKGGCFGWSLHGYKDRYGSEPPSKIAWNAREPIGDEVRGWITHKNIKYAHRKVK